MLRQQQVQLTELLEALEQNPEARNLFTQLAQGFGENVQQGRMQPQHAVARAQQITSPQINVAQKQDYTVYGMSLRSIFSSLDENTIDQIVELATQILIEEVLNQGNGLRLYGNDFKEKLSVCGVNLHQLFALTAQLNGFGDSRVNMLDEGAKQLVIENKQHFIDTKQDLIWRRQQELSEEQRRKERQLQEQRRLEEELEKQPKLTNKTKYIPQEQEYVSSSAIEISGYEERIPANLSDIVNEEAKKRADIFARFGQEAIAFSGALNDLNSQAREILAKAKADVEAAAKARAEEEAKVKAEAEAKELARIEAEAKAKAEEEARVKAEEEIREKTRLEAEARAKAEAEKREAEETRKKKEFEDYVQKRVSEKLKQEKNKLAEKKRKIEEGIPEKIKTNEDKINKDNQAQKVREENQFKARFASFIEPILTHRDVILKRLFITAETRDAKCNALMQLKNLCEVGNLDYLETLVDYITSSKEFGAKWGTAKQITTGDFSNMIFPARVMYAQGNNGSDTADLILQVQMAVRELRSQIKKQRDDLSARQRQDAARLDKEVAENRSQLAALKEATKPDNDWRLELEPLVRNEIKEEERREREAVLERQRQAERRAERERQEMLRRAEAERQAAIEQKATEERRLERQRLAAIEEAQRRERQEAQERQARREEQQRELARQAQAERQLQLRRQEDAQRQNQRQVGFFGGFHSAVSSNSLSSPFNNDPFFSPENRARFQKEWEDDHKPGGFFSPENKARFEKEWEDDHKPGGFFNSSKKKK